MKRREDKISSCLGLSITISGLVTAGALVATLVFSNKPLEVDGQEELPSSFSTRLISDLSISPLGHVIAIVERPSVLFIYTIDEKFQSATEIDFTKLTHSSEPLHLISALAKTENSIEKSSELSPIERIPYAISEDGSRIAWSWAGQLFAGPLRKPMTLRRRLAFPAPVVTISFLGNDLVAMIHSGGALTLEKLSGRAFDLPSTRLSGSWSISGSGPFLVLSQFGTGKGLLINSLNRRFEVFPTKRTGTFSTVSPKGQVAIGTSEGEILFPQSFGAVPSVLLPQLEPVQALAFYDEENIFAGTETGRLFIVEDRASSRLAATLPPFKILALGSSRIAIVTNSGSIITAKLRRVMLTEHTKWLLGVSFSILGLFAFVRLIATDATKWFFVNREGSKTDAPSEGLSKDVLENLPRTIGEGEVFSFAPEGWVPRSELVNLPTTNQKQLEETSQSSEAHPRDQDTESPPATILPNPTSSASAEHDNN